MARRVLLLDTSVLCCYLKIPGRETAGPRGDVWDHDRIKALLGAEVGSTFVLPLATLIETGNHVSQAGDTFRTSNELAVIIRESANGSSPWAAFSDQAQLWTPDELVRISADWPPLALSGLSIGDATIKLVAEFYARAGFDVEIVTGDAGLKAYQPISPNLVPRRRR